MFKKIKIKPVFKNVFSLTIMFLFASVSIASAFDLGSFVGGGATGDAFEGAAKTVGFLGLIGLIVGYFPFTSPSGALAGLLKWLLSIFTFISVISFIVTGIMFMISGSEPGLREKAKSGVVYSIIGIVTGLSGWIILNTIVNLMESSI